MHRTSSRRLKKEEITGKKKTSSTVTQVTWCPAVAWQVGGRDPRDWTAEPPGQDFSGR